MNILLKIIVFVSFVFLVLFIAAWILLGPAGASGQIEVFIVPKNKKDFNVVEALKKQNFIKNADAFQFLLDTFSENEIIESGGYRLTKKMNAWQVLTKITNKQDLFWVTIYFCPRKEQVGERLAGVLGWSIEKINNWNDLYADDKSEYFEGVYYPDTYLLPADETAAQIAQRLIDRFNEKFAPLADEFLAKNIKWTTGLKIASLIAREAAGTEDMELISGIIWNRLDRNMRLQIDATMQYTLGRNANGGWWGRISLAEKQSDSPYNSYLNRGLPPTPICSPNIDFIKAALNPEETDCLYYLHDSSKQIHCAETYEEHKSNIKEYL